MAEQKTVDAVARIVAGVLYHPQPDMSGDIWKRLGDGPKQRCERAAEEILNVILEVGLE